MGVHALKEVYSQTTKQEVKDIVDMVREIYDTSVKRTQKDLDDLFDRYQKCSRFQYCKSGRKKKSTEERLIYRCNCFKKYKYHESEGKRVRDGNHKDLYQDCKSKVVFLKPNEEEEYTLEEGAVDLAHNHLPFTYTQNKKTQLKKLTDEEKRFIE